jgi:hypothetical protein
MEIIYKLLYSIKLMKDNNIVYAIGMIMYLQIILTDFI